jgi:DMSO/TMAO reductase YedYZ molybdopterin-dependent catalytic subunit
MRLDPAGPFKRDPLPPHAMRDRQTPTDDVIVLCHFGVARLDRDQWSLTIDGLVERPVELSFDELLHYPRVEVAAVHECCGSPFEPFQPTRRVANVRWAGARLADVLADRRPSGNASYLWAYGSDSGVFGGVTVDAYVKDLPLARVHADVLIGYELNGAALDAEHGFPARLVVPGFYGTTSVKWLHRITVADRRAVGPFTTRWYQDPQLDEADQPTGETTPVWSIAPESLIVSPAGGDSVESSRELEIWGWAWADGGVAKVDIRIGDGRWRPARVEAAQSWQWQRFWLPWTPRRPEKVELAVRAESTGGVLQPLSGARNAVQRVSVTVT